MRDCRGECALRVFLSGSDGGATEESLVNDWADCLATCVDAPPPDPSDFDDASPEPRDGIPTAPH